jgi:hypothetical protein
MSYEIGTASSAIDLLEKLDAFLTKGHALDMVPAATGNGILANILGTAASVLETITVSFSSATDFSVAGSVSGALGTGTAGTLFTCSVCSFTAQVGGVAWVNGDSITFVITAPWVQKRFSTVENLDANYCCWMAPGNDDLSEIYVAARRKSDVTGDYDGLRLNGFTSYNAGLDFRHQSGCMTSKGPFMQLLRVGDIPYWFIANGRRCIIIVKNSTYYMAAYLGLITPYMDGNSHPYPLFIGGSLAYNSEPAQDSTAWRWSVTEDNAALFCKANHKDSDTLPDSYSARLRRPDGVWSAYSYFDTNIDPYGGLWVPYYSVGTDLRAGLDGSYPIFPYALRETSPANIWGELDGVGWVSGHANTAENIIRQNGIPWLVVQNVFRTSKIDYMAVQLS